MLTIGDTEGISKSRNIDKRVQWKGFACSRGYCSGSTAGRFGRYGR